MKAKTLLLALIVLPALAVPAQTKTFHVTVVRDWAATDPAPVSRAFKTYVVIGTVGATRYTTEQMFSWGSQHFAVGTDYEIVKSDDKSLTIVMHDKKGREIKERLDVVGAEELETAK